MKELDNEGFGFVANRKSYWCRMLKGEAWVLSWHPNNHWVTQGKIKQQEIWLLPRNLDDAKLLMYHKMHREWEAKQPHIANNDSRA